MDDTHNTSCGKVDGWGSKNDVEEDGFIYCPYCGRIIKQLRKFKDSVKVEQEKKPSEEINDLWVSRITLHEKISKKLCSNAPISLDKVDIVIQWLDENWPKVVKK